jgi:hypothetical protein
LIKPNDEFFTPQLFFWSPNFDQKGSECLLPQESMSHDNDEDICKPNFDEKEVDGRNESRGSHTLHHHAPRRGNTSTAGISSSSPSSFQQIRLTHTLDFHGYVILA